MRCRARHRQTAIDRARDGARRSEPQIRPPAADGRHGARESRCRRTRWLGLIGLGALGSRIATRLLRTGFSLEIYDIADVALRMFNMDVGGIITGSPKMM